MIRRAICFLAAFATASVCAPATLTFRDVTQPAGIRFKFATDLRRGRMIATMGGGVAAADFDGDGFLDLYFTGSADNGKHPERGPCGVLYRNRGDGTFEDVTARSGIRSCGWQMGADWIDVDSDGRPDLLVTGLGGTRLWMNNGDGTFRETPVSSGLDVGRRFAIGAAAGDFDGDGRVDLYILGYLDTTPEKELSFPQFQMRLPEDYDGQPGTLFRQRADATWEGVTASAGVANKGGKGTGAVFFDYDGDGRPDLYIANDRVPNRLYHNEGRGVFRDVTDEAGAGARGEKARAGMGIAIGDPFHNGFPDIFVTNFSGQTNTYYRSVEGQLFDEATELTNTGRPDWNYVKWGTQFADFDNDGFPDLYTVAGNLAPRFVNWVARLSNRKHLAETAIGDRAYRQPVTLWRNDGSRFEDVTKSSGDLAKTRLSARGSAVGDFDGDGRLDLAIAAVSGGARLCRNVTEKCGHAIEILPAAGENRRTALGTKIRVTAGGLIQTQEFIVQPSYASGSWTPLHFGIGAAGSVDKIEVIPPGSTSVSAVFTSIAAGRLYRLRDGKLEVVRAFQR